MEWLLRPLYFVRGFLYPGPSKTMHLQILPSLDLGESKAAGAGGSASSKLSTDFTDYTDFGRILLERLGDKISFPGSSAYESSVESYFSQQAAELRPACIISPTSAEDVAVTIKTFANLAASAAPRDQAGIRLSIRSGGHASFAGANNADGGVTLDLRGLNQVEVSPDRTLVSVGAGCRWGDVYTVLDPLGISVVGGRAAQVGVGGLATGGGISNLSPRRGWACDNVRCYEIVLADGSIVRADETRPELLRALRGGSNNFGVVTRLELNAFPQGQMFGGSMYCMLDDVDQHILAFKNFAASETYDLDASLIMSFGFQGGSGAVTVFNAELTRNDENAEVLKPFKEFPSLFSTLRTASVTELAIEQGSFGPQQDGHRQLSAVTVFRPEVSIMKAAFDLWSATIERFEHIDGMSFCITLGPLPEAIYARAPSSNSLGLEGTSGPLVVLLLTSSWSDSAHDDLINVSAKRLMTNIEAAAKETGTFHPFKYLNYAASWQQPIASYGLERVERLRRVSKEVDPAGFFQKCVPGGFKIPAGT